jgi:TusA-related sulfurtransferase
MARHVTLDVRGMEPPEPIERVLETIADFQDGDTLKLVIDCMPIPLFRILERSGFGHHLEPGTESLYEITIWPKPEAEPSDGTDAGA